MLTFLWQWYTGKILLEIFHNFLIYYFMIYLIFNRISFSLQSSQYTFSKKARQKLYRLEMLHAENI